MSQTIHSPAPPDESSHDDQAPRTPLNAQLSGIFGSLWRVAKLELNILVTNAKLAAVRIVVSCILAIVALLLGLVGIVILDFALYYTLTDLLKIPTAQSLFIFAGFHFLLAAIVAAFAARTLRSRRAKKKEK